MQGKRHVAHGAKMMAHRAALAVGTHDQRIAFAHRQTFKAVRAVRLAGDAIPEARIVAAAATRDLGKNAVRGSQTDAFHRSPPSREGMGYGYPDGCVPARRAVRGAL